MPQFQVRGLQDDNCQADERGPWCCPSRLRMQETFESKDEVIVCADIKQKAARSDAEATLRKRDFWKKCLADNTINLKVSDHSISQHGPGQ